MEIQDRVKHDLRMHRFWTLPVVLAGMLGFVPSASGTPTGSLRLASGAGQIVFGATSFDWSPPTGPTNGSFVVSTGTILAYSGGVVGGGEMGLLRDFTSSSVFPIANFMTIAAHPVLALDLTSVGPGSSNANCGAVSAIGTSCSISVGHPLVLTLQATGTSVALAVTGVARDATLPNNTWIGLFTMEVTSLPGVAAGTVVRPVDIQNYFSANPGGSISSPYSATLTTTDLGALANLQLTNTDAPDPVAATANLTYTLTAVNNGPSPAANVTLNDPLSASTTFVSAACAADWTCTAPPFGSTGTFSATKSSLAVGASAIFTVTVKVSPPNTTIVNTATISSNTSDPDLANNTATARTEVRGCAPHTTHLHISTVPPSHSGNVSHEHHGQHGHTAAANCPPHVPGHSAGLQEDIGKDFVPDEGVQGLDFVGAFNPDEPAGAVRRGSVVTLFSAPGRITIEDAVAAEQLSYTTSVPVVRIGGIPARVLFSGLAPGQTDTWEIRAVVPNEVKPGRLPVTITYEGEQMNSVGVVVE